MTEQQLAAVKQALSTLQGWANHGNWLWPETALATCKRNTEEAITALQAIVDEQALAQPAAREPMYLLSALEAIATEVYDSWSNGARAKRIAEAAINRYEAAHGIAAPQQQGDTP